MNLVTSYQKTNSPKRIYDLKSFSMKTNIELINELFNPYRSSICGFIVLHYFDYNELLENICEKQIRNIYFKCGNETFMLTNFDILRTMSTDEIKRLREVEIEYSAAGFTKVTL